MCLLFILLKTLKLLLHAPMLHEVFGNLPTQRWSYGAKKQHTAIIIIIIIIITDF